MARYSNSHRDSGRGKRSPSAPRPIENDTASGSLLLKGSSHSVGSIGGGRLVDGMRMTDFQPYHQVLRQESHKHNWAHSATGVYIDQLSQRAQTVLSHGLIIGEMSGKGGGHITGHATHTNGLSVDIYFKPLPKDGLGQKDREMDNNPALQVSLLNMPPAQQREHFKTMALAYDDPRVRDGYLNPKLIPLYKAWANSKEARDWAAENNVRIRTDGIKRVPGHDYHFHVNLFNPEASQANANPAAYDAAALGKKYGVPASPERMAGFLGKESYTRIAAANGWNATAVAALEKDKVRVASTDPTFAPGGRPAVLGFIGNGRAPDNSKAVESDPNSNYAKVLKERYEKRMATREALLHPPAVKPVAAQPEPKPAPKPVPVETAKASKFPPLPRATPELVPNEILRVQIGDNLPRDKMAKAVDFMNQLAGPGPKDTLPARFKDKVKEVQTALNARGEKIPVDGKWNDATGDLYLKYQRQEQGQASGAPRAQTAQALQPRPPAGPRG